MPGSLVEVVNVGMCINVQFTRMMGSVCCGFPYFWCLWSTFQYIEYKNNNIFCTKSLDEIVMPSVIIQRIFVGC